MGGTWGSLRGSAIIAGQDLMDVIRTKEGRSLILSDITFRTATDTAVCINNKRDANGTLIYDNLLTDATGAYVLNLSESQVLISSFKIEDACTIDAYYIMK